MRRFIPDKDLLKLIEDWALIHGASKARETCQFYFTKRTQSGVMPTIRKPIPRRWVEKALTRQHFLCSRCRKPLDPFKMVGDHRVPLIKGGAHKLRNIDAMHPHCNSSKGSNDQFTEAKLTGRTILEQESNSFQDEEETP